MLSDFMKNSLQKKRIIIKVICPKGFFDFFSISILYYFFNICLNALEQTSKKNIDSEDTNDKLIEILIHSLVNYIPSPFNKDLILKIFKNKDDVYIQKLEVYPYIDFDLCRIYLILSQLMNLS